MDIVKSQYKFLSFLLNSKTKSLKSLSSQQATRHYGISPVGTIFVDNFAAICGKMPTVLLNLPNYI